VVSHETFEAMKSMWFDSDLFQHRAIINIKDDSFGVAFTHWTRRRHSWSLRWEDVLAIETMVVEEPCFELGFVFQVAQGRSGFLSDDMENWESLKETVRSRFPDLDWGTFEMARLYENKNKRLLCWKRSGAG
jgi:hypothetical protein